MNRTVHKFSKIGCILWKVNVLQCEAHKTRDAIPGELSPVYRGMSLLIGLCVSVLLGCGSDSPTQPADDNVVIVTLPGGAKMEFVWIEPGTFMMGANPGELGADRLYEYPLHQVTLTRGFYLGKTEITRKQWESVMGRSQEGNDVTGSDLPAVSMTWYEAQEFTQKLNEMEGRDVYRLPTEAEWEYTCRAGTDTPWWFGNVWATHAADRVWFDRNSEGRVHPVGTKLPNPWGLYDMHGNVSEWVADWFGIYSGEPETDPANLERPPPSSPWDVTATRRGGSFKDEIEQCRSAVRKPGYVQSGQDYVGFRVLREKLGF